MEENKKLINYKDIIYSKDWMNVAEVDADETENCMKEAVKQALEICTQKILEELEVDYNFIGNRDENSVIEVFFKRGELNKIKENLLKELI